MNMQQVNDYMEGLFGEEDEPEHAEEDESVEYDSDEIDDNNYRTMEDWIEED